jgi:histone H3/H4
MESVRYCGGVDMSDMVIVKAKLKELAKGYNVSSDFAEMLDVRCKTLIADAIKRAESNSRKTVMAKDL